jgi:hypothetical protein
MEGGHMGSVELDKEEKALTLEILEDYLSDLRMEIVDTSSSGEFKKDLKARETRLKGIIGQFKSSLN